jgi:hypothetical protein
MLVLIRKINGLFIKMNVDQPQNGLELIQQIILVKNIVLMLINLLLHNLIQDMMLWDHVLIKLILKQDILKFKNLMLIKELNLEISKQI